MVPPALRRGGRLGRRPRRGRRRWADGLDPTASGLAADRSAFGVVAATIAAATLTFLGVVFSTTLVAVQLAASQYSPRIVRLFVRSRLTQSTLAVFVATFVFAITALVGIESDDAPVVPSKTLAVMLVLVLATVFVFVVFMHGIVRLLRVQYLLRLTARSSHGAIDDAFPPSERYREVDRPADDAGREPCAGAGCRGDGERPRARCRPSTWPASPGGRDPRVLGGGRVSPGNHVGPAATVARIHGPGKAELTDALVLGCFLFGTERTLLQDPGFGFRQLVDTASRALSPAINDPTTGGAGAPSGRRPARADPDRPDPTGWYTDAAGVARVKTSRPSFAGSCAWGSPRSPLRRRRAAGGSRPARHVRRAHRSRAARAGGGPGRAAPHIVAAIESATAEPFR